MARVMESQRNAKRLPVRSLLARGAGTDTQTGRALFDAQDDIDRRREQLIAEIEGKLQQRVMQTKLFSIRWALT
jgi:hypothetical protein